MKAPKNRKKAFRVDCANCHATQDSMHFLCSQCRKPLYTNMTEAELQGITDQVESLEKAIVEIETPKKGDPNPYSPLDQAWATFKQLKGHAYLPGMSAYLDRVLEVLLPIKVRLMQRTVKANWIFLIVLLAFPLVTVLFRMHFSILVLLLLPAIVWTGVAFKATRDLRRTRERLAQIITP